MTQTSTTHVVRRVALGLVRRAREVGITLELTPGRVTVVRVSKTAALEALRRLPLGSRVRAEDVFGMLCLGEL